MKIPFILLIFISLYSCNTVSHHNKAYNSPIPKKDILSDIDFVYKKLTNLHPHLYDFISEEDFKYQFDSLKSTINSPLTKDELYFKLSPLIASIRQGHTLLRPTNLKLTKEEVSHYKKYGASPLSKFKFEVFNEKLHLIENKSSDSTIKIGSEIISIDNISIQKIKEKYRKTYSSDGYNETLFDKKFAIQFPYYIYKEKGILDSILIKYAFNDTVYSKVLKKEITLKKLTLEKDKKVKKLFNKSQKSNILTFDETDSCIAILKVTNFSHNQYRSVFEKIDSVGSDHLIIDLRYNPGGRLDYSAKLYSYLIDSTYNYIDREEFTSRISHLTRINLSEKPVVKFIYYTVFSPFIILKNAILTTKIKKDGDRFFIVPPSNATVNPSEKFNFKGKIYVIINGASFSASSVLSSNLKHKKLAFFVGEETGGAQNECVAGFIPTFILPHSKLKLNFGLMNLQSHGRSKIKGRGVFPDKEIKPTIEDRINGVDPELEWILHDIKHVHH